jgi:hypothetical protein
VPVENGTYRIPEELFGTNAEIRRVDSGSEAYLVESLPRKLYIPPRPPAPAGLRAEDGKITGTDSSMEYSGDDGVTWKGVSGNAIENLSPGTYLVRCKATDSAFASLRGSLAISNGGSVSSPSGGSDGVTPGGGNGNGNGGGGGGGSASPPTDGSNDKSPGADSAAPDSAAPDNAWLFADVLASDWFFGDVAYVYGKGLMFGVSETRFEPQSPITRGMIVTILHRAAGSPAADTGAAFRDVTDASLWYYEGVNWSARVDLGRGVGEGLFEPDRAVTRQELATFLYRYANFSGQNPQGGTAVTLPFYDADRIEYWAADAMTWTYRSGVIKGKPGNILDPQNTATRAETAAMLHRFTEAAEE